MFVCPGQEWRRYQRLVASWSALFSELGASWELGMRDASPLQLGGMQLVEGAYGGTLFGKAAGNAGILVSMAGLRAARHAAHSLMLCCTPC